MVYTHQLDNKAFTRTLSLQKKNPYRMMYAGPHFSLPSLKGNIEIGKKKGTDMLI